MTELLAERFSLGSARSGLKRLRGQLLGLSASLPDILATANSIAKSGYVPVQLDPLSIEQLTGLRNERQSLKGPLAAALIIASALLVDQSWLLAGGALVIAGVVLIRKS